MFLFLLLALFFGVFLVSGEMGLSWFSCFSNGFLSISGFLGFLTLFFFVSLCVFFVYVYVFCVFLALCMRVCISLSLSVCIILYLRLCI